MATIKEVAEQAGVSVATVSRVVNKSGYVSADLEQRVRDAMRRLNYKPSALARSLRRQVTQTIGVLVPQLDQPFFSTLAFAVEKTLFGNDYRALVCSSEESREKEDAYIDILLRQRVDGVVIAPTGHSAENIHRLIDAGIPVVIVDRDLPHVQVNRVLTTNREGAAAGVRHLLELGHRRIGLIGGAPHSEAMNHRLDGAKQVLIAGGGELDPALIVVNRLPEFDLGYAAALHMLNRPAQQRPTAIFALNDVMAMGVYHAAAELGLMLPFDLSVVGFDDIPAASYIVPALTTVAQPIYAMGETAAHSLLQHIQDTSLPLETMHLETVLVVRKSTAPMEGTA